MLAVSPTGRRICARVCIAVAMPCSMMRVTSAAEMLPPACGSTSQPSGTGVPFWYCVTPSLTTCKSVPSGRGAGVMEVSAYFTRFCGPWSPPGPTTSSVTPARSMRPSGRSISGSAGTPPSVPMRIPSAELPPTAAKAMYSASSDRSGFFGS